MSSSNITKSIYTLEYPQSTVLVPDVTFVRKENYDNIDYLYLGLLESNSNNIVLQNTNDSDSTIVVDPKIERIRVVNQHMNDLNTTPSIRTERMLFDNTNDNKIVLPDPAHIARLRKQPYIPNQQVDSNNIDISDNNKSEDYNTSDIHKTLSNIHNIIRGLDPDKLKTIHDNLEATLTVYKLTKEPNLLQYIVIGYLQEMIKTANGKSK